MSSGKIIAGIDAGHVDTKAVLMEVGGGLVARASSPTRFDAVSAARTAFEGACQGAGISSSHITGIVSTGIFREVLRASALPVIATVSDYVADVTGAFFLDGQSRTVIDIGGNIHKAMYYDGKGNLLDVIQNDKCADGLGFFYSSMAVILGVTERGLSELALESTRDIRVAIQCGLCAESEAIDLMCQGAETADVANAVTRFVSERVAAMCTYLPLNGEIVAAGGLARSPALIKHLSGLLQRDVKTLALPEYVGAIGAAITYGGDI